MRYELLWDTGKRSTWEGETPEEAARRFIDNERVMGRELPGESVVAWRDAERHGIWPGSRDMRVIE